MKNRLTLLMLMAPFFAANAQMRLGIMGGPHTSTIIEKNNIEGWDQQTKPYYSGRGGLNVGFIGEVQLGYSKRFFLQPGLFYMTKGRKFEQSFDTTATGSDTLFTNSNFNTNYIDLPINVMMKLPLGKKSNFIISAGPYLSFYFNGTLTTETRRGDGFDNIIYTKDEANIDVGKYKQMVKTFDLGVNARAGFEIGGLLLTAFMSQGLTNFYNAPYNGTLKHRVIGASAGFWLNKRKLESADRDGDGVPDKLDMCPDVPGLKSTGGCPDRDGDGIADAVDKCPDVKGLARWKGCPDPDKDHDSVLDVDDKCPDIPGLPKYQGCPVPDTDGDGVNDEQDMCPDKPGSPEFNGCPIPDTDGDGINDKEDKCPTIAGVASNAGCPIIKKEIVEKVNFAARNIFFGTGSDKVLAGSYAALDNVASILKADRTLKLAVEGHSDNTGIAEKNLALSQKRADAVKNFLVNKGIAAGRLEAKGFGQEKPIADNSTPGGRATNRRVELKLSNH
jgi:OmpA-OmpF porin, OOP family